MIMDCARYRVHVPILAERTKEMTPEERAEFIGIYSCYTHVPIIVIACFMGEPYGVTEDLRQHIELIKAFYGIKAVRNTTCNP